ncbi:hypothetical protein MKZ20_08325 [Psychrobacillus sp. FSL K6-2684]|uniref:hypothetical protein n=1 Tax=Psychrobacillus sp. FSL K6-2684 TaxID=2921547 RepID=UPI0030F73AB1
MELKTQYFVQYSNDSIINRFVIPKETFTSISIGIRNVGTDFIFPLVQNMFSFPIFFVLENDIFEQGKSIISERNIPSYKFSSNGFIIKIESVDTLEAFCDISVDLALNGISVFIFFGQGLYEEDLVPLTQWNKPIEFKNLDFQKVETFIDVSEVGTTIFSRNNKFNSPRKVSYFISASYSLDIENSDL